MATCMVNIVSLYTNRKSNPNKVYNLRNEISKLNEIRNDQDIFAKEIYKLNPITRLIYGKQFEIRFRISD